MSLSEKIKKVITVGDDDLSTDINNTQNRKYDEIYKYFDQNRCVEARNIGYDEQNNRGVYHVVLNLSESDHLLAMLEFDQIFKDFISESI